MKKLTEKELENVSGSYSAKNAACAVGMGGATFFLGFAVSAAFGPIGLGVYSVGSWIASDYICSQIPVERTDMSSGIGDQVER